MNENVKGGFSYKAEWDNTRKSWKQNSYFKKVRFWISCHRVWPGLAYWISVNKYNLTGDYVAKQFKWNASENMHGWMLEMTTILQNDFIRINGDGKKQASNPVVSIKSSSSCRLLKSLCSCQITLQVNSSWSTYLKPSFIKKRWTSGCFRLGFLETCEIRCRRQWIYCELIRC